MCTVAHSMVRASMLQGESKHVEDWGSMLKLGHIREARSSEKKIQQKINCHRGVQLDIPSHAALYSGLGRLVCLASHGSNEEHYEISLAFALHSAKLASVCVSMSWLTNKVWAANCLLAAGTGWLSINYSPSHNSWLAGCLLTWLVGWPTILTRLPL